ncbi:MAG: GFA family protein [Thalassobaculaceae bacterium]|nr:GFA family protein [Thalassobaculaceae bacterium]
MVGDALETRTARCGCGAVSVTVIGQPHEVYACGCLNCQRETGSVFTYTASYRGVVATVAGEVRLWRRTVDSGRWCENGFCPTCGTHVFSRSEFEADLIKIAVGCFADPDFQAPETLYYATRSHRWLGLPESTVQLDTQPD